MESPPRRPLKLGRGFGRSLESFLLSDDFEERLPEWLQSAQLKTINPLFAFLCSLDDLLKWRAVRTIGLLTAKMAEGNMEDARVIVRRLIWSLNDESGGIGWGAAEAMGEIMACHEGLAEEYYRILVSYICEDGNRPENDLLERGALWGFGRLAKTRPELLQDSVERLAPYLRSKDAIQRGYAAWAAGFLDATSIQDALEPLLLDGAQVRIYRDGGFREMEIRELAAKALRGEGSRP